MGQNIGEFAKKIRAGELVAFPTETVYGVGANAFDPIAVAKIFAIKGRPSDNPLIVHIPSIAKLDTVSSGVNNLARQVLEKFAPGPITVLVPKHQDLPTITTAGSPYVGVRIPNHPVALEFLQLADVPVAAPSANKSGKPSGTHHRHVQEAFGDELPNVIEGGQSAFGLESTVVFPRDNQIEILRQGSISLEELQQAFPEYHVYLSQENNSERVIAPGTKYKHYAPNGAITILPLNGSIVEIENEFIKHPTERIILLCSEEMKRKLSLVVPTILLGSEVNLITIAQNLYGALLACDRQNYSKILIQSFPEIGIGRTIMERIRRAADST
ncbi:threonylcarbamoyl-AMP synthase [bacterium]|nr:threonylcarbamoyl-AMP synthase [bacterium]